MIKRISILLILSFLICLSHFSLAEDNQFDKYGGWKGLKGEKKGYFHTEKIDDRWWIITPEGNVFWSIGTYCVRLSGIPEKETNRRPYKETCLNKYGSENEWARITRLRLKKWGFNTIGDWSSGSIYAEPGFAYVAGMDLPRKTANVIPKGSYGYFPDVFSQEFRDSIRENMENRFKSQLYLVDDPKLLGYFLADEPSWYGSKQRRGALTDDFIDLDSTAPGKKAWVEFLKSRYKNIGDLNSAWGMNLKSFDELLRLSKLKDSDSTEKDKLAFLSIIAEEFSKVLAGTLREFDKYHMILGTRPTRLYPEVISAIGKYSDIFSTSAYGLNQGYIIDPKFDETIDEIYKYSGKPVLLGVMIPAQDAGLSYGIVKTQKDRGVSYWRYLAKIAANPAVVGVHWFQYFDPPKRCYDERAANWGLVNEQDEPYKDAVDLISQANNSVYAYRLELSSFIPSFGDDIIGKKEEKAAENSSKMTLIPADNLDFEKGASGWQMQTWKGKSRASLDSMVRHNGRLSLKIQGGPDEGWGSVGVGFMGKPNLVLKPSFQYKLSAWVKTKDVENSAFVRIKVKYKSGEATYFETPGAYGTGDWKFVEITFSPREENTVEYLCAQLVGKETAWFDDITLELME